MFTHYTDARVQPIQLRSPVQYLPTGDAILKQARTSKASADTPQEWPEVERRAGGDRRVRPTRGWDALIRRGRRARGRRASDRVRTYIDLYHRGDVSLVLATFVLNLLDAFLTLQWLRMGGAEGNPLMDSLIQSGDLAFLAQKCFVVGALLILLIVHRNFGLARVGLWVLFGVYAAVLIYHGFLQLPILLG